MDSKRKKYLETKLKKINDKILNIDSGGCGVFASYLYHALIEKGLKPKIYMVHYSRNSLYLNGVLKNNKRGEDALEVGMLDWTHFIIKLDGYLIDNAGVIKTIKEHKESTFANARISRATVSIEVLDSLTWEFISFWNRRYKRRNNARLKPMINKMVRNMP